MTTIFVEVPTKFRPMAGFEIREGFDVNDFELLEAPILLPSGSTSASQIDGLTTLVLIGHYVRDAY